MKEYSAAVFIGRFQPFHDTHLAIVKRGLEIAEKVIILVGSSNSARTVKNPFTFEERKTMIYESTRGTNTRQAIIVCGLRDYYYNQNAWIASVQAITDFYIQPGDSVALLGAYKDASSYYLSSFPQWEHKASLPGNEHATEIRNALYQASVNEQGNIITNWEGKLSSYKLPVVSAPPAVRSAIAKLVSTPEFAAICREWQFTNNYKKSWEAAPFPPTFVTTDCVVECSGHVLVVQRKFNPGKGLYALPGGFLKQDEFIQDGALRELKEETGIRVEKIVLRSNIINSHVFDHPDRSARGRTITHAFHIKLKDGYLPEVKGNDDASVAKWMPLWDVIKNEETFFEDHAHIINYFIGVGAQGER